MKIDEICKYLGEPYTIRTIDNAPVIYRKINEDYEFEVTGFFGRNPLTINLWQIHPHQELLVVYTNIKDKQDLKDLLGYWSSVVQDIPSRIRVEREDWK